MPADGEVTCIPSINKCTIINRSHCHILFYPLPYALWICSTVSRKGNHFPAIQDEPDERAAGEQYIYCFVYNTILIVVHCNYIYNLFCNFIRKCIYV